MTHLAPWSRRLFTIEVKLDIRYGASRRPVRFALLPQITQQVDHRRRSHQRGRAQGQAANSAQLLFKLAGDGPFNGQVAGVVGTGRQFIDQ